MSMNEQAFIFFVLLFIEMTQRATTLNVSASCLGGKKTHRLATIHTFSSFLFFLHQELPCFLLSETIYIWTSCLPAPTISCPSTRKKKIKEEFFVKMC